MENNRILISEDNAKHIINTIYNADKPLRGTWKWLLYEMNVEACDVDEDGNESWYDAGVNIPSMSYFQRHNSYMFYEKVNGKEYIMIGLLRYELTDDVKSLFKEDGGFESLIH